MVVNDPKIRPYFLLGNDIKGKSLDSPCQVSTGVQDPLVYHVDWDITNPLWTILDYLTIYLSIYLSIYLHGDRHIVAILNGVLGKKEKETWQSAWPSEPHDHTFQIFRYSNLIKSVCPKKNKSKYIYIYKYIYSAHIMIYIYIPGFRLSTPPPIYM